MNDTALPCPESESGETFGRYNNVDIAYGVKLGRGNACRVDVAVVSDRGCDRVRFFAIDPLNPNSPLTDITSPDVARVFPQRYDQPSAIQSPDPAEEGFTDNPLDDQNTAYGLTVDQEHLNNVFVTERERGLVRQLEIEPTSAGTLTYRVVRTFLFETSFDLKDLKGERYTWTPCREAVQEEPQSKAWCSMPRTTCFTLPSRPSASTTAGEGLDARIHHCRRRPSHRACSLIRPGVSRDS